jgi:alpha-ribazole phosphatase
MLKLTLLRHGKVEFLNQGICYGWTDIELNDEGIADARRAGESLQDELFDAVYSSPLVRTTQTAKIVMAHNQRDQTLPIQELSALREYHFGEWEGVKYEEILSENADDWTLYMSGSQEFAPPNGETIKSFVQRVCDCMDGLRGKHTDGNILIVSHYGVISVIIPYLLELFGKTAWKFALNTGRIAQLEVTPDFARLVKLNL